MYIAWYYPNKSTKNSLEKQIFRRVLYLRVVNCRVCHNYLCRYLCICLAFCIFVDEIVDMFAEYGIGENSVNRQICNQIYDEPSIESGYIVETSSIHVEPGSSLTILFKDRVTLSDSFYVDRDAKLELCQVE